MARLRERRERADEIAAEPPQIRVPVRAIETGVEARERCTVRVAVTFEATDVGIGALDLIVAVLDEPRVDVVVRELLDERRREPDRDLVRDIVVAQVVQQPQERQVGAEDRLVHPLLAVRPATSAARVRQVRMKDESEGFGHTARTVFDIGPIVS